MADTNGLFTSDKPYATAADYEGVTEVTVIEQAGVDEYNGESFAWVKVGAVEKPIRLNKTNGRGLAAKFGGDTDGWVAKEVFLTTAEGKFDDGRNWVGFRLSPVNKRTDAKPAESAKPFDDNIPF